MSKAKKQSSTGTPAGAGSSSETQSTPATAIPFARLKVSRWNRSYGVTPDSAYVAELAKDIKKHGLLHQLTLVADGADFAILAGAHRFAALQTLPEQKNEVRPDQYKLMSGLTEADEECLKISLAENQHRRPSSAIETARYAARLMAEQKINQDKLSKMLKVSAASVSRMQKLVACFDQLPAGWRDDLSTPAPSEGDDKRMTLAHWVEVAGRIGDKSITPEVVGVLEKAKSDKLSSRELREALKPEPTPTGAPTSTPAPTTKKPTLIQVLKTLQRQLDNALAELRGKREDLVAPISKLNQVITKEITKLEPPQVKPAKQKQQPVPEPGSAIPGAAPVQKVA